MIKSNKSGGKPQNIGRREQPKGDSQLIFRVDEETTLLPFLLKILSDKSRSHVKSLLAHRQVMVNNSATTQFDTPLKRGFEVKITSSGANQTLNHSMLRIVYEDSSLIVVEKKEGLLSIANDKTRDRTAYYILSEYVKKKHHTNKIFIVHRLDRETSGLMIYAKKQEIQEQLQALWHKVIVERKYIAVLEGDLNPREGVIKSYLTENKNLKVFAVNQGEGLLAVTNYKVMSSNNDYSLVEFQLQTGRKNQIRAHAEFVHHSIAGDKKYGATTNPLGRVALHAYKLSFIHPITNETLRFETQIPKGFKQLAEEIRK